MVIGSSVEGLDIARALKLELDHNVESTVWHQGVFGLTEGSLAAVVRAAHEYDFAALVLTPDDVVWSRDQRRNAPRDNVLFEAGLFMGALGPECTFLVLCRDHDVKLPSDFAGITAAEFSERVDKNMRAALSEVAFNIWAAMQREGPFETYPARNAAVVRFIRAMRSVDAVTASFQGRQPSSRMSARDAEFYDAALTDVQAIRPHNSLIATLAPIARKAKRPTYADALDDLVIMRGGLMSDPWTG